jgi:hypothetical protein
VGVTNSAQPASTGAIQYQWANESGAHGMARPSYLEARGWVKVRQHPLWPKSWLMRKEAT